MEKLSDKDYQLLKNCAYVWLSEYEDFVEEEATINGRIDEEAFQALHDKIIATRGALTHAMQLLTLNGLREPKIEFTDDEKTVLRNLPEEYKWIARDKDGGLCVYDEKPLKSADMWGVLVVGYFVFSAYKHLFQNIQWSDEEPCEFRKYL